MKAIVPVLEDIDARQFDWRHEDLQIEVFGQNGRKATRSVRRIIILGRYCPTKFRYRLAMAPNQKHPPGPPMTLGNMRRQGVHHLIAFCHNDACRHQAIIDVSKYPDDVEVSWFQGRIKCGNCGRRGRWVDLRPNWAEKSAMPKNWEGRSAWEK
jgi:hypothetical protein